jgi:hypothetical protein
MSFGSHKKNTQQKGRGQGQTSAKVGEELGSPLAAAADLPRLDMAPSSLAISRSLSASRGLAA